MDNMRSHHVEAVGELLRKNGMIPLYLPPYSPDLNPIEMMWSKMKAILRKSKIRKPEEIQDAIQQALALVAPDDVRPLVCSLGRLLIILMAAIVDLAHLILKRIDIMLIRIKIHSLFALQHFPQKAFLPH